MISMIASGDSQRIASGHLTSSDTTSLHAMLAQADALANGIRQVLASREAAAPGEKNPTTGTVEHSGDTTDDVPMETN